MLWIFIFAAMGLAAIAGFIFIINRMTKVEFMLRTFRGRKGAAIAATAGLLALIAVCFVWSGAWNTMIIMIHLLVFWLISEGVFTLVARLSGKLSIGRFSGAVAIIVTVCYLGVGMFCAYHVWRTDYTIDIAKEIGDGGLKIVGFSDSHVGTTFHADKFADFVERMNAENPDVVVIVGDFVDDDTSYEDMVKSCEYLSGLKTKYGVFYVYGNHDAGYYSSRGYSSKELEQCLEANNITVLKDKAVALTHNIYLCGRQDARTDSRATMGELMQTIAADAGGKSAAGSADASGYTVIVLDHEPNDYDAEAQAGADLVISGHTHGGQFIPITKAGEWLRQNDMTYGYAKQGNTNFIVSSGISDWAMKFKTGCISEYFVINVR